MEVITAPAKLNLYLRVLGLTPENYHRLKMVNASITLADKLEVSETDDSFHLECTGYATGVFGEDLSKVRNNILYKTYQNFSKSFSKIFGISVRLEKNIPVGAGLGGGSSDAAALLMYFARKYLGIKKDFHLDPQLLTCAKAIGADVPYFLAQSPCIVEGIGDILSPVAVPILRYHEVTVVVPSVQLSTQSVFNAYDNGGKPAAYGLKDVCGGTLESLKDLKPLIVNDLYETAAGIASPIAWLSEAFSQASLLSGLTGTGSALFVVTRKGEEGSRELVKHIGSRFGCAVFPANFLNS